MSKAIFGIKIQDTRPGGGWLCFGLSDILDVIGEPALSSEWRCLNLWCIATRDETVYEFRERRLRFTGKELFEFAARVQQTIEGEFIAKKQGSNKAWLIIKAVDSSWFEVWSSKPKLLEEFKSRFTKVSSIPNAGLEQALGADSP